MWRTYKILLLFMFYSIGFCQWVNWNTKTINNNSSSGALRTVNDSLFYFNYPQSSTGKPIYYWWSSSAGYLYILADSLGVGSSGDPTATGMIKVDSLGDGSLHQPSTASINTKSVYFDSLTWYYTDTGKSFPRATTDDWTVEFWVYVTGDYYTVANKYAFIFAGTNVGKPKLYFPGYNFAGPQWSRDTGPTAVVSGDSSKVLAYGRWNHIALVHDATDSLKLYQGGIGVPDTLSASAGDGYNFSILYIGGGTGYRLKGYLDELRLWSTERTISQINAAKDAELNGNEAGLAYYWKFNDALTCDRTDSTSTLTLDGAPGTTTYSTETPF